MTPDTATAGSDGTNDYLWDAIDRGTEGTGPDSFFGDPPDTNGDQFAASDTKMLAPDQGLSLDTCDVLEVQVNVHGFRTTDWSTARVQVQIDYVLR